MIDVYRDMQSICDKLQAFRGHPDWRAALDRIQAQRRDFFVEFEPGRFGIPEAKAEAFLEAVDQEFIAAIGRYTVCLLPGKCK